MTVVAAIISRHCTAHSSDSLITRNSDEGTHEILDEVSTKIVPVREWRGIMAFWGLAVEPELYKWSTLDWLRERVSHAGEFNGPEPFALDLSERLNRVLSRMTFRRPNDKGLGIHFTAYERVDGYETPEFFLISNFADASYTQLRPDGIGVSRETYHHAYCVDPQPEHRDAGFRHAVRDYLDRDGLLLYNNGDPLMFNPYAGATFDALRVAAERRILRLPADARTYRQFVSQPVELVSRLQRNYVKEGHRLVGGALHNLSVGPRDDYESDTGDRC